MEKLIFHYDTDKDGYTEYFVFKPKENLIENYILKNDNKTFYINFQEKIINCSELWEAEKENLIENFCDFCFEKKFDKSKYFWEILK